MDKLEAGDNDEYEVKVSIVFDNPAPQLAHWHVEINFIGHCVCMMELRNHRGTNVPSFKRDVRSSSGTSVEINRGRGAFTSPAAMREAAQTCSLNGQPYHLLDKNCQCWVLTALESLFPAEHMRAQIDRVLRVTKEPHKPFQKHVDTSASVTGQRTGYHVQYGSDGVGAIARAEGYRVNAGVDGLARAHVGLNADTGWNVDTRTGNVEAKFLGFGFQAGTNGVGLSNPFGGFHLG